MHTVYCSLRKSWVSATPEELVRQRLIQYMTRDLGYPIQDLVLEKSIHQFPHLALSSIPIPDRRVDLVCLSKDIDSEHALFPLLLVECKAVPLTRHVLEQIVGYNHYLRAKFLAIVNQYEIKMGWYENEKKGYYFLDALHPYKVLKEKVLIK